MSPLRVLIFRMVLVACLFVAALPQSPAAPGVPGIELRLAGSYSAGVFNAGAAEIAAYDAKTRRLFVVNGAASAVDVLDVSDPSALHLLFSIDVTPYGRQANSVDVDKGVVAVAVEANVKTDPGRAVFFDADGNYLNSVAVGALPDMLTFTPDGKTVVVANEGEPNSYGQPGSVDPEGSVSIINLKHGAARLSQADMVTAGFSAFNFAALDPSIRIYGPGASVAQDLEPEYIAVSHDSKTAWVTLQENNAIGVLDIKRGVFTELVGLGFKDHSLTGNGLDASDRDGPSNTGRVNIANWPVFGMYQPDAIASFRYRGNTYLLTANEGDARDYTGFSEERRVSSLALDPAAFPNAAALKTNAQLGRLNVTAVNGNTDADAEYERLYAFGARSFSIRAASGALVYDSGDQLEQLTAQFLPNFFNSDNAANNSFDTRSDNKGPEPEAVEVGDVYGRTYAFVGMERVGGVAVYDITDPFNPRFVQYVNNRDFAGDAAAGTAGDLGPEGLLFIPESESPTHKPLLVVANEISGTTTVYEIAKSN